MKNKTIKIKIIRRKVNKRGRSNKTKPKVTKRHNKTRVFKSRTPRDIERASLVIAKSLKHPNTAHGIENPIQNHVMAFIMGILEVLMYDMHNQSVSLKYYIPLFLFFGLSLWLYRKQIAVNEANYLREMIEHHDMALFTSKNLLDKPLISPKVRDFAKKIVNTQTKEIDEMKQLIQQHDTNTNNNTN